MITETTLPASFTFTIDQPYSFYIHLKVYKPHLGTGLWRFPVAITAEPSIAEWRLSSVIILLDQSWSRTMSMRRFDAALRLVNFNQVSFAIVHRHQPVINQSITFHNYYMRLYGCQKLINLKKRAAYVLWRSDDRWIHMDTAGLTII